MKFSQPPLACVLKGPHTSKCISTRGTSALSPLAENGLLVILPSIQDLQTDREPTFNSLKDHPLVFQFYLGLNDQVLDATCMYHLYDKYFTIQQ